MNTETMILNTENWFDADQDAEWLAMYEMMLDGAEYTEGLNRTN